MTGLLIAFAVLAAAGVLIALYLLLLPDLYPEQVRTNEVSYIRTEDLWLLRVCRYRKDNAAGEPVLLVHGMGANQNNFTYPPNGCLVDYLSAKGYDCWTLDLRGSRSSIPPFKHSRREVRMEDFFMQDLPAIIRHILETTSYTKVHWIGHSMGGMLLYAYVQAHGGKLLASGTTLGSPIDFSDAAGNVPVGLITLGERYPRLSGTLIRGLIPLLKTLHIAQGAFPVNMHNVPGSMRSVHFVNMIEDPLPQLMSQVKYWISNKEYKLRDGQMDVTEGLSDFSVPLLAFYAAKDPFIDAPRAMEFFNAIKLKDKRAVLCSKEEGFVEDYSHCDLAFGREAAVEIFKPVYEWLKAHPCASPTGKHKRSAPSPVKKEQTSLPPDTVPKLKGDTKAETPPEGAKLAAAKAKPKAAVKSKVKTKASVRKRSSAPAKASAPKKAAAKKKPAAKKKTATTRNAAKKKAAAPSQSNKADQEPIGEGLEISPEAQARAASIRAARNQTLSEIESLLSKELKETK